MHICYVDESGESGTFQATDRNANPFFVVVGLIVAHSRLIPLTHDFLRIKTRFFPGHFHELSLALDSILVEVKGNDLRRYLREGNRRVWSQTIGYIDACMRLLSQHGVRLLGRALIKNPGEENSDPAFYGRSMMHLCQHFNTFLELNAEHGFVIADGRKVAQNKRTTHTIFTQRHQARGNSYPRIVEMPSYGHSNNFAMLQLADMVCSAVIFPMLIDAFGTHLAGIDNVHTAPKYASIRSRYKNIVKDLQFMYQDASSMWVGGMLISDKTGLNRKTGLLFR